VGKALSHTAETDHLKQFSDALATSVTSREAKANVALDREVREQAPVLGDVANPTSIGIDEMCLVVNDLAPKANAPSIGAFESRDHS
jgi:hypothetical protein